MVGRLALLVTVTAACGRFGYDALDLPDAHTDIDAATDAMPATGIDAPLAPCPERTSEISDGAPVCIEQDERGVASWTDAQAMCVAVGRRLCTDAEWLDACHNASELKDMYNDQNGTALEWEWVADRVDTSALKRGYTECESTSTHAIDAPYDFRCCVDRPSGM